MEQDLISFFLQTQSQLKVLHWQTTSYARHMAYGRIYDSVQDPIDSFIEIYQGKYKRIKVDTGMRLTNINEDGANQFVESVINILTNDLPSMLDPKVDTDLLNIKDEILAEFNTLKYLLTLK